MVATTSAIDNDSVPIVTVHNMSSGVRLNPSSTSGPTTRSTRWSTARHSSSAAQSHDAA